MYPICRDKNKQSLGLAVRIGALAAGMLAMPAALAQASASIALTSEYSARGVSLSDGRAAPQLSLAYDAPQGWFAGVFAAPRLAVGERRDVTQVVTYGGFARRLASGLSWEAGVSNYAFLHAAEYGYREAWAGIASDRLSARLSLAPAYYGFGGRVAYAEVNGFYPLRERVKLIGHVGALHGRRGPERFDMRLGVGFDLGDCNLQLAWLAGVHTQAPVPRALALSAAYSF